MYLGKYTVNSVGNDGNVNLLIIIVEICLKKSNIQFTEYQSRDNTECRNHTEYRDNTK